MNLAGTILAIGIATTASALVSCSVDNDNDMSCVEKDCEVSCEHLGFIGGNCVNDVCACEETTDEYKWDGGDTDIDPDASPDSGKGL